MDLFCAQTLLDYAEAYLPTSLSAPEYSDAELLHLNNELRRKYNLNEKFGPELTEPKRQYAFAVATTITSGKRHRLFTDLPFKKDDWTVFEKLGKMMSKRPQPGSTNSSSAATTQRSSSNGLARSSSSSSSSSAAAVSGGKPSNEVKRPRTMLDSIATPVTDSEDASDKFIELAVSTDSGAGFETKQVSTDHVLRLLFELVEQQKQELASTRKIIEQQGRQLQYLTSLARSHFAETTREIQETKGAIGELAQTVAIIGRSSPRLGPSGSRPHHFGEQPLSTGEAVPDHDLDAFVDSI